MGSVERTLLSAAVDVGVVSGVRQGDGACGIALKLVFEWIESSYPKLREVPFIPCRND